MSEELQNPPVVDLDLVFQPISGEDPSGEDVRYSGIYDQIREARRADDEGLNMGDWKTEVKVADFRLVIDLAVPCLTSTSKDLQVAVWLGEALTRTYGFAGLRDSLKILAGLQDRFWETLHPQIEDGDEEARANALSWADREFASSIKFAKITGGVGYTYRDWETSQSLALPDNIDSLVASEQAALRQEFAQAEAEGKVTTDRWTKDVADTRRPFIENVNLLIEECWTAFADLNRIIDEKFDRNQAPAMTEFRKGLERIQQQVKKILEQKRSEEPDPIDFEEAAEEGSDAGDGTSQAGGGSRSGSIQSRRDALARLGEIARFFQATEPHSPVSYMVQRAVKWGNMPLDTWLQEVIKDESVLYSLRETLGVTGQQGEGY